MPKESAKLTATAIKTMKYDPANSSANKRSGGKGLFIVVNADGKKWWRFDYTRPTGGRNSISFGEWGYTEKEGVTLELANKMRDEVRAKLSQGIDPSSERKEAKEAIKRQGLTFEGVASEFIDKKRNEGKSEKYIASIKSKLDMYIYPLIGKKQMIQIKRADVMEALRVADRKSPHSAQKALAYTKAIFTYAENMGYVEFSVIGSVVAKNVLTKTESKNFKHITDLKRFGELLNAIDDYNGEFVTRQLLRFMPLVMTRPTEARLAKWCEIDFDKEVWAIPAARMKMRHDHIVPLSRQAIAILKEIQPFTAHKELIFASCYGGNKIMSENTINNALKRLGFGDEQTGHGFRHSSSTILHEHINEHGAHSLVIEACLAHKDSNEIRAIYNKAQYLEERRRLMQWYADFLDGLK